MDARRKYQNRLFQPVLTVLGAGLLVVTVAQAADRIETIKPSKLNLPTGAKNADIGSTPGQPFDFLAPRGSSGGIAEPLPPPSLNSLNSNKKLMELFDQKKNWMFSKPAGSDGGSGINSLFEGKGESLKGGGEDKKAIQRFLEENDRGSLSKSKTSSTNNVSNDDLFGDDSKNRLGLSSDQSLTGRDSEKSFGVSDLKYKSSQNLADAKNKVSTEKQDDPLVNNATETTSNLQTLNSPGATFGLSGTSSMSEIRRDQENRMDRLNKLFEPAGGPGETLSGPLDPINFKNDATLTPFNPIFPKAAELPGAKSLPGSMLTGVGSGPAAGITPAQIQGASTRSSAFDKLDGTISSASIAAPAMIIPPASRIQPRPGVLEFPKRQF